MSEPYTGPDRRTTPDKIIELEDATRRLSGEVSGLRSAIETVGDVTKRQLEVEEAARESRQMMEEGLLPKVARLDEVVVPRDEHKLREREHLWITVGAVVVAIHVHEVARDVCGHGGTDKVQPHQAHGVHAVCDVVFPESTAHSFPSAGNVVGFGCYLALVALGVRRYAAARRHRLHIAERKDH